MLKVRFAWLLYLLLSTIGSSAMSTSSPCTSSAMPDVQLLKRLATTPQPNKGLLWKVSKAGKDAHLYGTIHVAKLEWDFPGPAVLNALENSSVLAVEVDTTDLNFLQKMAEESQLASKSSLGESSAKAVATLESRVANLFKTMCVDEAQFQGASLSSKITSLELLSAPDQSLSPVYSIDVSLISFSKATHKKVVELETIEQQAAALAASLATMERDVSNIESGESRKQLIRLATAWEHGDLKDLETYLEWCGCEVDSAANARLISERNAGLTQNMIQAFDNQSGVFVAIGILHLVGPGGVVERLRQAGYFVERIDR